MSDTRRELARIIAEQNDFLVVAHTNPDGDAVGSTAAMGWILEALGKRYFLYNRTGMPRGFDWLSLPAPLLTSLPGEEIEWIISLDCGALSRVGPEAEAVWPDKHTINIDHHLGNPDFADYNWVRTTYSSTGEMVARLAEELGVPLSGPLGEAVYTAIVTDTGNFSYDSTTTRTMAVASRIMEQGLRPGPINARIQNQWSREHICLMREVLGSADLLHGGRIGVIRIPHAAMAACGALREDADGLINMLRRVRGVEIAIALREETDGNIKFSLRSHGDVNVQQVAALFGGGGHKNASGGTLPPPMASAAQTIVDACAAILPEA
ncbi:phosphoesterase RecJ domain protein [Desulfovibrio sp. X2]|uniref:DHH family phosphoesterase n=1 Tax=Desulfovibrio sp. X2 TaxID=941449 RepID=UPI000358935C|nr:bifunctional oligoribonuclease/PAP phosphatase NrnA [Desulfovibrio sp. X2]EPR44237.1 phosphoesterase RecJ domain protein [Desulfovibrio sp. X2]